VFLWFTNNGRNNGGGDNSDRNNRLIYLDVGTLSNGILISKDVDVSIDTEVVREDNTTIIFVITAHDNTNSNITDNKQATDYSWNLSNPKFNSIKICNMVHKNLSYTAWYLKQLLSIKTTKR